MWSCGFPYTSSGIYLATEKLNSGSKAGRDPSSAEEEEQIFTGSALGSGSQWQQASGRANLGKLWERNGAGPALCCGQW